MKQHSLGLGMTAKRTRRREFLDEMEKVVPWADLVALVLPYLPEGKRGRPPFSPETMLRIPFHAAVVRVERSGDGRGASRHARVPRVCGA